MRQIIMLSCCNTMKIMTLRKPPSYAAFLNSNDIPSAF